MEFGLYESVVLLNITLMCVTAGETAFHGEMLTLYTLFDFANYTLS